MNLAILAMVRLELGVSVMPALYLHEDHPGVTVRPLVPRAHRQLGSLPARPGQSLPAAAGFSFAPKDHGGYALSLVCSLDFFPFSVLKEKCYMA